MALAASRSHAPFARLSHDVRQRSLETAHAILQRIGDTSDLELHVARSIEQSDHGGWHGPALAQGNAGLALAHAVLARAYDAEPLADSHADSASHYLRAAVNDTADDPLHSASLCSGTAGLLLAAEATADVESRFRPALGGLRAALDRQLADQPPLESQRQITDTDYDFMTGRAGILALVGQPSPGDGEGFSRETVWRLVDDLVWAGARDADDPQLWRWMINRDSAISLSFQDESFPQNFLNLSVSHGLAAITAALAMVGTNHSEFVPAVAETLRTHAEWLKDRAEHDSAGALVWPTGFRVEDDGTEKRHGEVNLSTTWCYGGAGIAMAIDNAAVALGDSQLADIAAASMLQHLERALGVTAPVTNVCHGAAGNILLIGELGARLDVNRYDEALEEQVVDLIDRADPDLPLLYDDREAGTTRVDQPGMLNGAAGVALTLATVASPVRPTWLNTWMTSPAGGGRR